MLLSITCVPFAVSQKSCSLVHVDCASLCCEDALELDGSTWEGSKLVADIDEADRPGRGGGRSG